MREETQKYISKAKDCLQDAEVLLAGQRWAGVINRSYYAVYDCIQALLFEKEIFTKTHQGAQSKFYEYFIQTQIFPLELGKFVKKLFEKRQASDYDPDSEFTETDVTEVLNQSYVFLEKTKNYLENKI